MDTESTNLNDIAKLNDKFRRSMTGCTVSRGVAEYALLLPDIFAKVRDFADFNKDNDPHGEHDFGSFELLGIKFFWKIDYYDQELKFWCDPLDQRCRRVLTIMCAEEY